MWGVKPSLSELSVNSLANVFHFLELKDTMAAAATQTSMKNIIFNRENRCSLSWSLHIQFDISCCTIHSDPIGLLLPSVTSDPHAPYFIDFEHDSFYVCLTSFDPATTSTYFDSEHYKFVISMGQLIDDIIIHLTTDLVFALTMDHTHEKLLSDFDVTPHHVILNATILPPETFCSPMYIWQNVELIEFNADSWTQYKDFISESFPKTCRLSFSGSMEQWFRCCLDDIKPDQRFHNIELSDVGVFSELDWFEMFEKCKKTNALTSINILDTTVRNFLILKESTHHENSEEPSTFVGPIQFPPIRHFILNWAFNSGDREWNTKRTDCPWSFSSGIETFSLDLCNANSGYLQGLHWSPIYAEDKTSHVAKMLMLVVFPMLVELSHHSTLRYVDLVFRGFPLKVRDSHASECPQIIPKKWLTEFFERNRVGNALKDIVSVSFDWESSLLGRPRLTTNYIKNILEQRFRFKVVL